MPGGRKHNYFLIIIRVLTFQRGISSYERIIFLITDIGASSLSSFTDFSLKMSDCLLVCVLILSVCVSGSCCCQSEFSIQFSRFHLFVPSNDFNDIDACFIIIEIDL